MTKFYAYFNALMLSSLVLLSACSPVSTQEPVQEPETVEQMPTNPAPTPAASPTVASLESLEDIDLPQGVELEFWHAWSGSQAEVFEALVEDFNQTNQWGIQVTMDGHGDELVMLDDVSQALQTDELPDLVAAPSRYLRLWDQQGIAIKDLDIYIGSQNLGFAPEALNAFLPSFWNSDIEDEKRLGVPAYRSGHFLFYNQSWARELGFEGYPQTITAFTEQACTAAEANLLDSVVENNGTGGWIFDIQSIAMLSWFEAFSGGGLIAQDGGVNFVTDSSQTTLETLYDLYSQDCAWTGKQSVPYEYFAKRYALFYSGSSEDLFIQELANQDNGNTDEWILIPYPSDDHRPVVYVDGASYALIGADEDKNLAAWLFIRFMLTEENQVRIIEKTGSLPVSTTAISLLSDFRTAHPAWDQALQYIALAQPTPLFPQWIGLEPVFSDIAWQLKFTLTKENIPAILTEADAIVQGMSAD